MLLRFVAISLLILLVARLVGRLLAAMFGGRSQGATASSRPTTKRPPRRQLEPCAHCGTYFDPHRSLGAAGEPALRFCSQGCVEAHAIEGPSSEREPAADRRSGEQSP